ncbi:hypothetical protein [Streptomyces lunalinharesii]|uniref:Secreted protein n=1 Tax=Streptomyces lunalinharesii TaxID=333384 RepID=A0ABN3SQ36_9ACTN
MTTEDFGAPGHPADTDRPHSPAQPDRPAAPRALWTRPWAPGLAGLVVGAAAVGATWLTLADGDDAGGSGVGRTSTSTVTLPAAVGAFVEFQGAAHRSGNRGADQTARRIATSDAQSTSLLSRAYGGAGAAVRTYAQPADLSVTFMVGVVRGGSPAPFVPYQDAAALGLVRPMREVRTVGGVACVLVNQPTPAGQTPRPDSVTVDHCQRTKEGLTVTVGNISGDLHNSPDQVAALVEDVWSDVT